MDFVEQLNQWGHEKKPFVFLIDFEQKKPLAWLADQCSDHFQFKFTKASSLKKSDTTLTETDQVSAIDDAGFANSKVNFKSEGLLTKYPITLDDYQHKYNQVIDALYKGDSFLMNLTIPTPVQNKLDFQTYFDHAKSKYVIWLKEQFIAFSPETFIQIQNGKIATFPMKGTIDASLPNAKELLLNDPKEYAEHATIVDLLRNDLSRVASKVRVTNFRYYEEIPTQNGVIGQMSSAIEGELPTNYASKIGSILYDLLPAGSVSGAPKKKTAELIASIEGTDRGYYTGIAGYQEMINKVYVPVF
ncbi:MAG: aminodeoxychorismate synthase component I [Chitinophagia bacterium]|nr:aminodeoxychorismate synthase component I [Chitinophagia bacterium]